MTPKPSSWLGRGSDARGRSYERCNRIFMYDGFADHRQATRTPEEAMIDFIGYH